MFAKFYGIPSLPFQDIEKPKMSHGRTDEQQTTFSGGLKAGYAPINVSPRSVCACVCVGGGGYPGD